MEELSPIKTIKANFGSPKDFTPPSSSSFWGRMEKESQECDADGTCLAWEEHTLWESSLTPQQKTTYTELQAKVDAALDSYDSRIHDKNSPQAKAYFAADKELTDFRVSTGKHLCISCAYYFYDSYFNKVGVCEWASSQNPNKEPPFVRPASLACKHYTDILTADLERDRASYQRNMSRISPSVKNLRKNNAQHFCDLLRESPSTAFFLYKRNHHYYDELYEAYDSLFKQTPYSTHALFLEAYERWQKEAKITSKIGANGQEEVSISIANPEFAGKDIPVPPTPPRT